MMKLEITQRRKGKFHVRIKQVLIRFEIFSELRGDIN